MDAEMKQLLMEIGQILAQMKVTSQSLLEKYRESKQSETKMEESTEALPSESSIAVQETKMEVSIEDESQSEMKVTTQALQEKFHESKKSETKNESITKNETKNFIPKPLILPQISTTSPARPDIFISDNIIINGAELTQPNCYISDQAILSPTSNFSFSLSSFTSDLPPFSLPQFHFCSHSYPFAELQPFSYGAQIPTLLFNNPLNITSSTYDDGIFTLSLSSFECPSLTQSNSSYIEASAALTAKGYSLMTVALDLQLSQFEDDERVLTVFATVDSAMGGKSSNNSEWRLIWEKGKNAYHVFTKMTQRDLQNVSSLILLRDSEVNSYILFSAELSFPSNKVQSTSSFDDGNGALYLFIENRTLGSPGLVSKNGKLFTMIDYRNEPNLMKICINYSNTKHRNPVLEVEIDFAEYLKELMHVGFSSSSVRCTDFYLSESFTFQTIGFLPISIPISMIDYEITDSLSADKFEQMLIKREYEHSMNVLSEKNIISWNATITGFVTGFGMLFDDMPMRNTASWNAMITEYCQGGMMRETRELFEQMLVKNSVSWMIMISGYVEVHSLVEGWNLFGRMHHSGLMPDQPMFVVALSAIIGLEALILVKSLCGIVIKNRYDEDVVIGTAILNAFTKSGRLDMAIDFFSKMPKRNGYSWMTMITAFSQSGRLDDAIAFYKRIPEPIVFSQTAMMTAYAQNGRVLDANVFVSTMSALSVFHPDANPALRGQDLYKSKQVRDKQIVQILGKAPTIATAYLRLAGRSPVLPSNNLSYSENFFYMLDSLGNRSYTPNPRLAHVLDALLILHAEHEMSCSTTASRHLASSGVDEYTTLAGAVGALYGPVPSLLLSEMFPTQVGAKAMVWCMVVLVQGRSLRPFVYILCNLLFMLITLSFDHHFRCLLAEDPEYYSLN